MKLAVIGSGGREHAIAWKFSQTVGWDNVFTIPGNGGIPNSHLVNVNDFDEVERFCMYNSIELLFVGPEQPLANGFVDHFRAKGFKVFGPDKKAAQLEASKVFAKQFMKKYNVATAEFDYFHNVNDAKFYAAQKSGNCVIKFDGLAAGKGVFVCSSLEEANEALSEISIQYGNFSKVLVEEKIVGDELSIIGFTDGKTIKLLQASQDHKQLLEGDKGPNTGGMGAYSPIPGLKEELIKKIKEKIVDPTLHGIKAEGMDYRGVIYFGIMVKENEPYLLEYNVRFGDPETEVLLPALKTDLLEITNACLKGNLSEVELEFESAYFADIVLASGGYPKTYDKGFEISGLDSLHNETLVFHAGTIMEEGMLKTNGGRVLNVVCRGNTLEESLQNAYNEITKIKFNKQYFRKDIGKRINKYL